MQNELNDFDIFSVREYFPSNENPSTSSWVLNQVKGIQEYHFIPLVISPTPIVPKWLQKLFRRKHSWKIKPSSTIHDYLGVKVIRPAYLKMPGTYFLNSNLKNASICISNAVKNFSSKIIHAHFGHAGISSIMLKKVKKIPLIVSFYGFDLGSDKSHLKLHYEQLAECGDLFLALSEDMKKDLIEIGFSEEKILIHHLGVDVEKFKPSNQNNIEKKYFNFTIVASYTERKGIHYAIEAYKKFKIQYRVYDCNLRIVGDGPFIKELKKKANGYSDIHFINNFISEDPRRVILEEMQNCDVFVLTSITLPNSDKEGTPVVLMEAGACGKPCISSNHAGIPEVVLDNNTGILVNEKDIDNISTAMYELYSDSNKRNLLGTNALEHIYNNYNNKKQIIELVDIYKGYI